MTQTFSEAAYLAGRPDFIGKVEAAAVHAAQDVSTEPDDGTDRERLRHALSQNIALNPDSYARQFAWLVAVNSAISFDSSDSDIQWTVNSVYDTVAGASPAPVTTTSTASAPVTSS